ncbi:MAG: polysaccharide export protein [Magnetococcales bacterium]|nr:polysaccharide export protein [Magnetococcales bacterium]NGZ28748.1 polysaccharide export protein [Magnetococcales bacterium]
MVYGFKRSGTGRFERSVRMLSISLVMMGGLSGCATFPAWLPSPGPSAEQVERLDGEAGAESPFSIPVVEVNEEVAQRVSAAHKSTRFSEAMTSRSAPNYVVGSGDVLEVSVWEAPPATLFNPLIYEPRVGMATARMATFPEQMVSEKGMIRIPFAGEITVVGKTPQELEDIIANRLAGKANQPQVVVRVSRNISHAVTVMGEVTSSLRMPLTAKGELLLDALAAAGGVRQPVGKMTVQLSRAGRVVAMPLESIIQDPGQNVMLQPGDIVTAFFQPMSFTALGASVRNEEINFEAQGITLAQALGRIGGLQDMRADAQGIFLFRFENPAALGESDKSATAPQENKVPVIYRADLKDPRSFLIAQKFPLRNKDVLYIANAPAAELQKFLNILSSATYSVSNIANSGSNVKDISRP